MSGTALLVMDAMLAGSDDVAAWLSCPWWSRVLDKAGGPDVPHP